MSSGPVGEYVERAWERSIVPELIEYIRIPNKSPAFDPEWQVHGYMEEAVGRFERWTQACPLRDMHVEVVRLDGRTPLLYIEVPANRPGSEGQDTVLLYGHLDKQPEISGWREGLGPWQPVLKGERLYGRGAADDGYAMFAALTAIAALEAEEIPHSRCVVLIEACEESGSFDLPHYIEVLSGRIGDPALVICLDSGCGNYDQLWCTTSLRGLAGGVLRVEVLEEGVHSGDASGIVPSSFRILRQLLDRIEDPRTGAILRPEFHCHIPKERRAQAAVAAEVLGPQIYRRLPFAGAMQPLSLDPLELVLNRSWRPALAVVGAEGLPPLERAGNVLRPATAIKLSLRLPPTCDAAAASAALGRLLEADPPYGAHVSFTPDWVASGWNAPPLAEWLEASVDRASRETFGRPAVYMGEGGSIPFMAMLGARYPAAQFLITGVLGPGSNAHGPNEFLHLPTAERLTCCVAQVLADHHRSEGSGAA
jgi:acetylornithine deacetylase/succinyl-diaminopimelate desuccinylase-like protein